jgi:hypothetical protein
VQPDFPTLADPWRPRDERWLGREPSRFAGRPGRPLFVGGCRRSGTTLLRSMLHNHPDLAMPAETDFVIPLFAQRVRFGDLRDPANRRAVAEWIFDPGVRGRGGRRIRAGIDRAEAIERVVAAPPTLGSIFAACFTMFAEAHGKERWGDKRPNYAPHARTVFELFPDAQLVNVVRDPRAAAASQVAMGWFEPEVALPASTGAWELAVERVDMYANRLRPDQLLDVRYEDLVRDPGAVLARVCEFAGLRGGEAVDEMITAQRRGHLRQDWHARVAEPVTTAPIASWRERLAGPAVALVEQATERHLARFGYVPVAAGAAPDPADLAALRAERRRRRRGWRRWAREELKRHHVLYRRPVAAVGHD